MKFKKMFSNSALIIINKEKEMLENIRLGKIGRFTQERTKNIDL